MATAHPSPRPAALLALLALIIAGAAAASADASTCAGAAAADLDARVAQKGFVGTSRRGRGGRTSSWGPATVTFPSAGPPAGCDSAGWARARINGANDRLVAQGFCYCHHHALWWMPGPRASNTCNPACVGTRPMPNQGADCSNYSAYLYNLAFGQRFTSAIGQQACKPGSAPGVMLPYTTQQQDQFQPGDLLFITQSSVNAAPVRVSHVVIWTGYTADFTTSGEARSWDTLYANLKPQEQAAAQAYADARRAAGLPVYVIVDSHYTGPNYRPFAGWYANSFSHGRRIIGADPSLPTSDPSVALWDGRNCMSYWALNGRGGRASGLAAARAAAAGSFSLPSDDATDASDDF